MATKSEILSYADNTYGQAKYVSQEDKNDRIVYSLIDGEYGFQYTITSYVRRAGMDGSTFWYHEAKSSDFSQKYQQYILRALQTDIDKFKLETSAEFIPGSFPDLIFAEIRIAYSTNSETSQELIKELGLQISQFDTRNFFEESQILVTSNDESENLGTYFIGAQAYKNQRDIELDYYLERASFLLNTNSIVYLYTKDFNVNDVPALSNEQIAYVLGTDMETIHCYYFTCGGKEYFIASINVCESDGQIHQYVYNVSDKKSLTGKLP